MHNHPTGDSMINTAQGSEKINSKGGNILIGVRCKVKSTTRDVEVHLLLQETSGAFSLTKRKEGI